MTTATTTRKPRRQPTEAQRAAAQEKRQRMRAFSASIKRMSDAERDALIARAGRIVTIEGRALSMKNTLMVAFQAPGATVVGGFNQWRAAGRMVRKGEHGFGIWAPTSRKSGDDVVTEDDGTRFVMVTMFDVTQTDEIEAAD